MRLNTSIITLFSLSLLVAGCGGSSDEDVIVSYKDNVFTRKQLSHSMPDGVTGPDSVRFARQAIDQWVMDQSVMDYALSLDVGLSERIAYKVEDYRAELIKHEFHSHLIADSMDSSVPESEILAYYEKNKASFLGKENLYCYFYLSTSSDNTEEAADWIRSSNYSEILKLKEWSRQNALDFKLDSAYVGEGVITQVSKGYFGELRRVGLGKLIRWNGVIQGERRRYLFKMIDVIENGASLPLSLCKDKIRSLLTNERKVLLIQNTDKRILENARANNYVREN